MQAGIVELVDKEIGARVLWIGVCGVGFGMDQGAKMSVIDSRLSAKFANMSFVCAFFVVCMHVGGELPVGGLGWWVSELTRGGVSVWGSGGLFDSLVRGVWPKRVNFMGLTEAFAAGGKRPVWREIAGDI